MSFLCKPPLLYSCDIDLETAWASDGRTGLSKALKENHALIILDLMLPELDGLEVCKQMLCRSQS